MAKRVSNYPQGTSIATALAIAIIAGAMVMYRTESWKITTAVVLVIMVMVSGDMFRAFTHMTALIVREGARVAVAFYRYRAQMYAEHQRTQREQIKWNSRLEAEKARQQTLLLRTATKATQRRIAQQQRAAMPVSDSVEFDEMVDVEYEIG